MGHFHVLISWMYHGRYTAVSQTVAITMSVCMEAADSRLGLRLLYRTKRVLVPRPETGCSSAKSTESRMSGRRGRLGDVMAPISAAVSSPCLPAPAAPGVSSQPHSASVVNAAQHHLFRNILYQNHDTGEINPATIWFLVVTFP